MVAHLTAGTDWEPWAAGQVKYLWRPDAKGEGVEAGFWRGTTTDLPPGTRVKYKRNELIYITSGKVRLEIEGGATIEAQTGEAVAFSAGQYVRWTILSQSFEEFFVYVPDIAGPRPAPKGGEVAPTA